MGAITVEPNIVQLPSSTSVIELYVHQVSVGVESQKRGGGMVVSDTTRYSFQKKGTGVLSARCQPMRNRHYRIAGGP